MTGSAGEQTDRNRIRAAVFWISVPRCYTLS